MAYEWNALVIYENLFLEEIIKFHFWREFFFPRRNPYLWFSTVLLLAEEMSCASAGAHQSPAQQCFIVIRLKETSDL